jgi:putative tryptophan/tyrosine transport system substrate-binding protein
VGGDNRAADWRADAVPRKKDSSALQDFRKDCGNSIGLDSNVQIDIKWGAGDTSWIRSAAAQLLQLSPDAIVANGTPSAKTMRQMSSTVPVIFIAGSDPVLDGWCRASPVQVAT